MSWKKWILIFLSFHALLIVLWLPLQSKILHENINFSCEVSKPCPTLGILKIHKEMYSLDLNRMSRVRNWAFIFWQSKCMLGLILLLVVKNHLDICGYGDRPWKRVSASCDWLRFWRSHIDSIFWHNIIFSCEVLNFVIWFLWHLLAQSIFFHLPLPTAVFGTCLDRLVLCWWPEVLISCVFSNFSSQPY